MESSSSERNTASVKKSEHIPSSLSGSWRKCRFKGDDLGVSRLTARSICLSRIDAHPDLPKHLRHGHRKDAVTHAQSPRFFDDLVLRIVFACLFEPLKESRNSLPTGKQICQGSLVLQARRRFEQRLVQYSGVYPHGLPLLLQLLTHAR